MITAPIPLRTCQLADTRTTRRVAVPNPVVQDRVGVECRAVDEPVGPQTDNVRVDDVIMLGTTDQALLQIVYDLMAQRGTWPTFTAVDLRADRDLAIEDAQAALAAVPPGYIRRPWGAYGFSDGDEVRLTLKGVAVCAGGEADLARVVELVTWTSEIESAAPATPEHEVMLSSDAFAAHRGTELDPPPADPEAATDVVDAGDMPELSSTAEPSPGTEGEGEAVESSSPAGSDASGTAIANTRNGVPPEIASARAQLTRLRVMAELLPRFWTGIRYQPEEPWRWQYTVDRQRMRPYRKVRRVGDLLRYTERQEQEMAIANALVRGQTLVRTEGHMIVSANVEPGRPDSVTQPSAPSEGTELAIQLTLLREEIAEVTAEAVHAGRFDDAIFAAFRRVEHEIQQRTASSTIGNELIKLAFRDSAQPIRISDRELDKQRMVELFSGAIGLYKGDRSHKDRPLLPCRSRRECLRILAYASSLLDLLDRDVDRAPAVRGYEQRQGDILTLSVERASAQATVWLNESIPLTTIRFRPGNLVVSIDAIPDGEHRIHLVDGTRQGPAATVWLARDPGHSSWYRVTEVGLPLFADAEGHRQFDTAAGVRLAVYEDGVKSERVVPTRQTYQVGHYVNWQSQTITEAMGAAWVREHVGGALVQVWDSSVLFDGQPLAPAHTERLTRISLEPRRLLIRPNTRVPLRVLGHYTDGIATWTEPVDDPAVASSEDKIAHFQGGVAYAKKPGSAVLRCLHEGCSAETSVEVAAYPRGTLTEFVTGLPPVTGVACTPKGLVVSTRGTDLWRSDYDGAYRLVAAVPPKSVQRQGTEALAAREDGELAVRIGGVRSVLVLHQDDDYASSHLVVPDADGVPMACVWAGAELLVAMNTGAICRVAMDGATTLVTTVEGTPVDMAAMNDAWVVLSRTSRRQPADHLWHMPIEDPSNHIDLLAETQVGGLGGVVWTGSDLMLSDFHEGTLLQLRNGRVSTVASGLVNPAQLTVGPAGDVYVAEFGAGAVRRLLS